MKLCRTILDVIIYNSLIHDFKVYILNSAVNSTFCTEMVGRTPFGRHCRIFLENKL